MNILITGHTGFIGRHLTPALIAQDRSIIGISRHLDPTLSTPQLQQIQISSIEQYPNWQETLTNVDTVIHLAARAHILNDTAENPAAEFFKVNTQGTINLAQAAIQAGVKHLIFISSIGAMTTISDDILSESSPCHPDTPYGQSKLAAETALIELCQDTSMHSTLVYGPGNPGNMERLIELVNSGLPLPIAAINNHRSFTYVGNLVDAIVTCLTHPGAKNQTFLIADGETISTPQLAQEIAKNLNQPCRLLPIPPAVLSLAGKLGDLLEKITGRSMPLNTNIVQRLSGSLWVDISHIQHSLAWHPPYTSTQGLQQTLKTWNF